MKKLLFVAALLFMAFSAKAQYYECQWYNFSQDKTTYDSITDGTPCNFITDTLIGNVIIPLPFTFKYSGINYNHVRVSVQGFIQFCELGAVDIYRGTSNKLGSFQYINIVAPLWDDLLTLTPATGSITYKMKIENDKDTVFVIQWNNVRWKVTGTPQNFQVRLHKNTSTVEIVYGTMTGVSGGSASIGINSSQDGGRSFACISLSPASLASGGATFNSNSANDAISYSSSNINTNLPSGTVYRFTPPTCAPGPGNIVVSEIVPGSAKVSWQSNSSNFSVLYMPATNNYWTAADTIHTNDKSITLNFPPSTNYKIRIVDNQCKTASAENVQVISPVGIPWKEGFENIANNGGTAFPTGMKTSNTTYFKSYLENASNIFTTPAQVSRTYPGYGYVQNFNLGYNVYLYTPFFFFKKDTLYRFSFSYITNGHNPTGTYYRQLAVEGTHSQFTATTVAADTNTRKTEIIPLGAPVITNPRNRDFEIYSFDFRFDKDTAMYLAIRYFSTQTSHAVSIDDISLIANPQCNLIKDLKVDPIDVYTAKATWTGQSRKYERGFKYLWEPVSKWKYDTVDRSSPDTIRGLSYGNTYNLQLRDFCNGNAESWSNVARFSTPCTPMTYLDLPYYRNFELDSTYGLPNCWDRKINTSSVVQVSTPTGISNTSGKGLRLYNNGTDPSTAYAILVSPPISKTVDINDLQIRFMAGAGYDKATLKVGITTADISALPQNIIIVDSIILTDKMLKSYSVPFSNLNITGEQYYIVLMNGLYASQQNVYIDDLYIETKPDCPDNEAFIVTDIGEDFIEVKWIKRHEENVVLEYRYANNSNANWILISNQIKDSTYLIDGLAQGTPYEIRLHTNCSENFHSLTVEAKTFCVQPAFPWEQGFENIIGDYMPECMEKTLNATAYQSIIPDDEHNRVPRTGNGCIVFNNPSKASSDKCNDWIFTPLMKLRKDNNYTLSFWLKVSLKDSKIWNRVSVKAGAQQLASAMNINMTSADNSFNDSTSQYIRYIASYRPDKDTTVCFGINVSAANLLETYLCIDDLKIRENACVEPININISNILRTSAKVSWGGDNGISSYYLQYRKKGDVDWKEDTVDFDAYYNLTGLSSATNYEVRIRTLCGSEQMSDEWSNVYSFQTDCGYMKIPMYEDFEGFYTGNIPPCWSSYRGGIVFHTHYYSPSHSLQINGSRTSVDTNTYGPMIILPVIDPAQDVRLLRTIFNGIVPKPMIGYNYKGGVIVGIMTDKDNRYTFDTIATFEFDNLTWNRYEVDFSSYKGPINTEHYIAFMHTRTDTSYTTAIFLDDIQVDSIPPCPDIEEIKVAKETLYSVTLNLVSEADQFEVSYRASFDTVWYTSTYQGNMVTIDGLTSGIEYVFRARSSCPSKGYGYYTELVYTLPCPSKVEIPYFEEFKYVPSSCWSQKTGLLTATPSALTNVQNWKRGNFGNDKDNRASVVVNIAGTSTAEWLISPEITVSEYQEQLIATFDVAFTKHNGSATADLSGSDDKFMVLVSRDGNWTTDNIIRRWSNNGIDSSLNSISATGKKVTIPLRNYMGKIRFAFYVESTVANANNDLFLQNLLIDEGNTCPLPNNFDTSHVATTAAAFAWDADGREEWEVRYGLKDAPISGLSEPIFVITPSIIIPGLEENTEYRIVVRTICNEIEIGNWVGMDFTTKTYIPCLPPKNIEPLNVSFHSFDVKWIPTQGENRWEVTASEEGAEDTLQNKDFANNTSYSFTGMESFVFYEVRVRSICDIGDTSAWSNPMKIQTQNDCKVVSNISVSFPTSTSAQVTWTADSSQSKWAVEYGKSGFAKGSGTKLAITESPEATLPNLETGESYDVYVNAVCSKNESNAIKQTFIMTTIKQINAGSVQISLSPNPAHENVILRIAGAKGNVKYILFDVSGKEVKTGNINCHEQVEQPINLNGLAKGVYTILLQHENWTDSQRLIVQ